MIAVCKRCCRQSWTQEVFAPAGLSLLFDIDRARVHGRAWTAWRTGASGGACGWASSAESASRSRNVPHLHLALTPSVRSSAVVDRIFFEIFSQVGPATTNTNHDSFAILADTANKKFDGSLPIRSGQMVQFDVLVTPLMTWSRSRGKHERWCACSRRHASPRGHARLAADSPVCRRSRLGVRQL